MSRNEIIAPPICVNCKRLRPAVYGQWGLRCDAFPDGIPEDIIASRADHRQPYDGDHGLQFLAKSAAAADDAQHIIGEAQKGSKVTLHADEMSNDWLYAWGDLPATLDGLRDYLQEQHIAVADFKNSARYEANYDLLPWLKDL